MFYRFLSKLATQERLKAFPAMLSEDAEEHNADRYEQQFTVITEPDPFPDFALNHAPQFDWPQPRGLLFNPGCGTTDLPDLWCVENQLFVSATAASVIKDLDPLAHDFTPIHWLDGDKRVIDTGQPWYQANLRRFLDIKPAKRIPTASELGFCPLNGHEEFLGRVLDDPALRERVERYPIWRQLAPSPDAQRLYQGRSVIYLNQSMLDGLRRAGVTGMDSYSQAFGIGEESLSAI